MGIFLLVVESFKKVRYILEDENDGCRPNKLGRTRTRAGKNPLVSTFPNVNRSRGGDEELTLRL